MSETTKEEKSNGAKDEKLTAVEKTDVDNASSTEVTTLEASIIRQVEYYFGDMNLPRDKFLQEQICLDDGWVPFDIMLKFKRLANISADAKVIADAMLKSESGIIEVSDDRKKLRRSPEHPLPELNEERRLELQSRTVYVKGFPLDSMIGNCLDFFKDYPSPAGVILRKYKDHSTSTWHFKGSIFVTFITRADAEKFMNLESVKINSVEAIRKWQKDYVEEKKVEFISRKNKKKDKITKEETTKVPVVEPPTIVLPHGTVLKVTEVPEKITKESIRDAINDLGGVVAYVDFQMGDKVGWIRLKVENSAKEVYEKFKDGKLTINNDDIPCQVLEGDEEEQFLQRMADQINKKQKERPMGNKKFKGGHKGGRQYQGKKRRVGRDEYEPRAKKEKA